MHLPQWLQDPGSVLAGVLAFSHLLHIPRYLKGREEMDLSQIMTGVSVIVTEVQPTLELIQALQVKGTDEQRIAAVEPALKAVLDKLPLPAEVKAVAEMEPVLNIVARLVALGEDLAGVDQPVIPIPLVNANGVAK